MAEFTLLALTTEEAITALLAIVAVGIVGFILFGKSSRGLAGGFAGEARTPSGRSVRRRTRTRVRRRERFVPKRYSPDLDRLRERDLPILRSPEELAAELGLDSFKKLVWLSDPFEFGDAKHYREWDVPKRSGGTRRISSPLPLLRGVQRRILRDILNHVAPESDAHGFERGRSVATNAAPHAGSQVVVNLDLEDFFPTITYRRVRGIFVKMGYSWGVSRYLALLCTHRRDWREAYRSLPQGAPTSPALSNLVCGRLDRRLSGLARKFGATYTRYADDITFSGDRNFERRLGRFFVILPRIIKREGFRVNWKKRRIRRKGARQTVTGVVVNERPTLPREERRKLRAMVHRLATRGDFEAPSGAKDPRAWLRGRLAYFRMIDPGVGGPLYESFVEATDKYRP